MPAPQISADGWPPRSPLMAGRSPLRSCTGLAGLLSLASLALLLGCARRVDPQPGRQALQGTAFVLIGSYGQVRLTQEVVEEQKELVELLEADFQQLHPGVTLAIELTHESRITRELEARSRDGLAPDLLLVNGSIARELHRKQLSRPVPLTPELRQLLRPQLRERIGSGPNQLVGVPVLLEPQLACFNRRRLPTSPTSIAALEAASEDGIEVGMALDAIDLYWSVGALGANAALINASQGRRLTPGEQEAALGWLRWLRSANMRERVNFFVHQEALLQGLLQGQLDWITCRSTSLGRLRSQLGDRLGVAVLPGGPGGAATPLLRQRMWVFGRESSRRQRQIAEAFSRFSLTPMMQRYLTLHTQELLPVSREVSMPTGGSPVLQAMVRSELQSRAADGISTRLKSGDQRLERISRLLLELIFAERTPEQARAELLVLLGGMP